MKQLMGLLVLGLCAFPATVAQADTVGTIQVCYNCSTNFGAIGVVDGPVFAINNTSLVAITNAVLTANGDSFVIGTIAAGAQFIIEPGVTDDGGSGHTFFAVTGGVLDTSDVGPNADNTPLSFTGKQGLVTVSATFTPGQTAGPSLDGTVSHTNFLGLDDGACNNCFFGQVATITTPTSAVPEPSGLQFLGTGLLGLIGLARRRIS